MPLFKLPSGRAYYVDPETCRMLSRVKQSTTARGILTRKGVPLVDHWALWHAVLARKHAAPGHK